MATRSWSNLTTQPQEKNTHHLFSFAKHEFHQFSICIICPKPPSSELLLAETGTSGCFAKAWIYTELFCFQQLCYVLGLPCCSLCQQLGECPWKWLVMISASPAPLMACRKATPPNFNQHWKRKEGWETSLKVQSDLEGVRAWFGH